MQQAKEAGIQTLVMIDEQGGKQKSLLLLAVLFVRHLICISFFLSHSQFECILVYTKFYGPWFVI